MASSQKFSHSTIHNLNKWVCSFDFNTKTNFIAYKLEGIKALGNIKIKWDFLRVVVKFWDPEDHVFQFKTAGLCPTIEEFSASWAMFQTKNLYRFLMIPGIGNLCLMLSVFLLPLLVA